MMGQKLRLFREFRNYSQEYIAEKLGITQTAYSRVENNQTKMTAERLSQLADILQVPVSELLSDKEPILQCHHAAFQYQSSGQEEHWKEVSENMRLRYEQTISNKDEKIAFLEREIHHLREERDRMIRLVEKITSNCIITA